MAFRGTRQFSRGGQSHPRRNYGNHYIRSRNGPDDAYDNVGNNNMYGSSYQHQQNDYNHRDQQQQQNHQQQQQPQQHSSKMQRRNSNQDDIADIKDICLKLTSELDTVKSLIADISGSLEQLRLQQRQQTSSSSNNHLAPTAANIATKTDNTKRKKPKPLRRRNKSERDQQSNLDGGDPVGPAERNADRRRNNQRREVKDKTLPMKPNDDSTTQAADPSSEDKIEGDNGGERVKRVIRRRKPNTGRRGYNRRNRVDSSERNSNDTSPQNEADEDDRRAVQSKDEISNDRPEEGVEKVEESCAQQS